MNKPVKLDMKLNSTQEIIDDIKAGKMVVIMDDEDRENEGDLVLASEVTTPEAIKERAAMALGEVAEFRPHVLVVLDDDSTIEVATFRKEGGYQDGRHPGHVEFSSAREDARRRDFTINGLFYDIATFSVIDYVGGLDDLEAGIIVTSRSADPGFDFVSRFFAPAVGIAEDPVTGSAHCTLVPYWAERLGKTSLAARQVSARGGVVRISAAAIRSSSPMNTVGSTNQPSPHSGRVAAPPPSASLAPSVFATLM